MMTSRACGITGNFDLRRRDITQRKHGDQQYAFFSHLVCPLRFFAEFALLARMDRSLEVVVEKLTHEMALKCTINTV